MTTLNRDLISFDSLSIHSNNIRRFTLPNALPLNILLVYDALNQKDRRRTTREEAVEVGQTESRRKQGRTRKWARALNFKDSPITLHRLGFLNLGLRRCPLVFSRRWCQSQTAWKKSAGWDNLWSFTRRGIACGASPHLTIKMRIVLYDTVLFVRTILLIVVSTHPPVICIWEQISTNGKYFPT